MVSRVKRDKALSSFFDDQHLPYNGTEGKATTTDLSRGSTVSGFIDVQWVYCHYSGSLSLKFLVVVMKLFDSTNSLSL